MIGKPTYEELEHKIKELEALKAERENNRVTFEKLKQTEDALREAKDRAQTYLNIAGVMFVALDAEGKIILTNRKGCEVLEYNTEEIMGKNWFDHFVPKEEREEVKAVFRRLMKGEIEIVEYYENNVLTKNGKERLIAWHNSVVTDKKGAITGVLSSGKDITEYMRVVKDLRLFINLINQSNDPVFLIDPETGRFLDFSDKACTSLGYERKKLLTMGISDIEALLSDDFSWENHVAEVRKNGYIFFESKHKRKDGTIFPVEVNIRSIIQAGMECMVAVARNTTRRKLIEHQVQKSKTMLQAVFDGISEPLIMVDKDMKINMLNKASWEYYNIDGPREVINKFCYFGFRGRSALCEGCEIPLKVANSKFHSFDRRGVVYPDRFEHVTIYPLNEEGEDGGAIIRINDITESKRVQEQLIRADRLASLGQLSGGIAHEIRNPLAGINLFVDILKDEDKFEQFNQEKEILDEIKDNIKKIDVIIKRILDFAKPTATCSGNIDMNSLIDESIKLWSEKFREKKIKLNLNLEEMLPDVYGDPIGLQQVIINLILNSIEAVKKNGVLEITTLKGMSAFYEGREAVLIIVKDNGPGIMPELLENIFNPFFTTKASGTGLGLAIVHQIIERHGGTITVESVLDRETAFTIELPFAS